MTTYGNLPQFAGGDGGGGGAPLDPAGDSAERSADRILDALETMATDVDRLIADRSAEELQRPSQDGGWGVVEILAHLLDWEEITVDRVGRVLAEARPELEEYDDSLWAIEHEYSSKDPFEVAGRFTALRRELVERLRALDDAGWQRTALLGGQEVRLRSLLGSVVDHDAEHLGQARDVLG